MLSLGLVSVLAAASRAQAQVLLHGIGLSKGCESPTLVGAPYSCSYSISNSPLIDTAGDTLTITSLVDTVHAKAGDTSSGNILPSLSFTPSGGATCNTGQTMCTLPSGSALVSADFSFYTVVPGDYTLTGHVLTDGANLTWQDTCSSGANNCPSGDQHATTGSQSTIELNPSATVTAINGDPTLTKVFAGSSVTDQATVSPGTGAAATTTPTGTVTFTFYTSGDCSTGGTVLTPDSNLVSGVATSGSEGPLTAGSYSFQATYNGDGTYNSSTGACEPLTVIGSTTVTAIQPSSTVAAGTSVTDKATVTGSDGGTPTGTVTFTFYTSGDCSTGGTVLTPDSNLVAGVATSGSEGPLTAGSYSFQATYNGETGVYPTSTGACEPLTVTATGNANFTPGFWKTHPQATTPLLPQTLGTYNVTTFAEASGILSGMGCGSAGALNCMAGMLLAADLNLAQGGSTCIVTNGTIGMANALLTTYNYNFTTNGLKKYKLSASDQALAMTLHDALSNYNIDGIPTC